MNRRQLRLFEKRGRQHKHQTEQVGTNTNGSDETRTANRIFICWHPTWACERLNAYIQRHQTELVGANNDSDYEGRALIGIWWRKSVHTSMTWMERKARREPQLVPVRASRNQNWPYFHDRKMSHPSTQDWRQKLKKGSTTSIGARLKWSAPTLAISDKG